MTLQELGRAADHRDDRNRLGMTDFRGEPIGLRDETVVAGAVMGAFDRRVHGLDRQRAGDAIPVAGVEREQQVAALKVGAANGVHAPSAVATDQHASTRVSVSCGICDSSRGVKAQPAQANLHAPKNEQQQGAVGDFASFMPIASSTARTTR